MPYLTSHPGLLIAIIVVSVLAVAGIFSAIVRKIRRAKNELLGGLSLSDISEAIKQAKEAENNPEPRTVFGATSIYLPKIEKDFSDFHYPDAVAAVKIFIDEYLAVKYEKAGKFRTSIVDDNVLSMIDISEDEHHVTDETVHQVAISDYRKTKEYATITFQASTGYKLDGRPVEERYSAQYTLKLREYGIEQKTLICPQCGGAFESTAQSKCPYCGAGIIRDTIFSWRFTSIEKS